MSVLGTSRSPKSFSFIQHKTTQIAVTFEDMNKIPSQDQILIWEGQTLILFLIISWNLNPNTTRCQYLVHLQLPNPFHSFKSVKTKLSTGTFGNRKIESYLLLGSPHHNSHPSYLSWVWPQSKHPTRWLLHFLVQQSQNPAESFHSFKSVRLQSVIQSTCSQICCLLKVSQSEAENIKIGQTVHWLFFKSILCYHGYVSRFYCTQSLNWEF